MKTKLKDLAIIEELLNSDNPTIRYKTKVLLLDESKESQEMKTLREEIRNSLMAISLLSNLQQNGTINTNPYKKWQSPLWTLVSLAHIDYPKGDEFLLPMRDQVYDWLLEEKHLKFPRSYLIPGQENRFRRCAGQEAYTIWFTLKLGIADERTDILVDRLKEWQWPDGGWNCDKRKEARKSSLIETFIPVQALDYYGKAKNDKTALNTAKRAAEVLLKRKLFKSQSTEVTINKNFVLLSYPNFYNYNILSTLRIIADIGLIHDERCTEALAKLLSKQLKNGGFPLEKRIIKTSSELITRGSNADWGNSGKKRHNAFVTIEALYILKKANRLSEIPLI